MTFCGLLSIVILQIHNSSDGRQLHATASKDGAIKVQNLRVQNTIVKVSSELLQSVSLHVKDLTLHFRYGME